MISIRRFYSLIAKVKIGKLVLFFSFSFMLTIASVLIPLITRNLINSGINNNSSSAIVWSAVGLGLIGIANLSLKLIVQSVEISISQGVVLQLRKRLSQALSWLSTNTKDSGYLMSRIQNDARNIGGFVRSIATLSNQSILLLASGILTWILLSSAIWILIPTVLLTFSIGLYAYRSLHKRSIVTMENGAIALGSVGELVEGKETLTAQGGTRIITQSVIKMQEKHVNSIKQVLFTQTRLTSITGVVRTIGLAVLLGWSGLRVAWGEITFGDWYALNLYAGLILGAAVSIANAMQNLGQTCHESG
jgi:ATP-binding cassette, subfamily B, bacterial